MFFSILVCIIGVCMLNVSKSQDKILGGAGVVFEDLGKIVPSSTFWFHSFVIDIPDESHMNPLLCRTFAESRESNRSCIADFNTPIYRNVKRMDEDIIFLVRELRESLGKSFLSFSGLSRYYRTDPLNTLGRIPSSIFGTATEEDLQTVVTYVNNLIRKNQKIAKVMTMDTDTLSSYTKVSDSRYDALWILLNDTRAIAKEVTAEMFMKGQYLKVYEKETNMMFHLMRITHAFTTHIREIQRAVYILQEGDLSPVLLSDEQINLILTFIENKIRRIYPGASLLHQGVAQYRRKSSYIVRYQTDTNKLWVTLKVPIIRSPPKQFYRISTFPVPLDNSLKHDMEIVDLPAFVSVLTVGKQELYTPLSAVDITDCMLTSEKHHDELFVCSKSRPEVDFKTFPCLTALLQGKSEFIRSYCKWVLKKGVPNRIIPATADQLIVIGVQKVHLECSDHNRDIKGCLFCILQIPCACLPSGQTLFLRTRDVCKKNVQQASHHHLANFLTFKDDAALSVYRYTEVSQFFSKPMQRYIHAIEIDSFLFHKDDDIRRHIPLSTDTLKKKIDKNDTVFLNLEEEILLSGEFCREAASITSLEVIRTLNCLWLVCFPLLSVFFNWRWKRNCNKKLEIRIQENNADTSETTETSEITEVTAFLETDL